MGLCVYGKTKKWLSNIFSTGSGADKNQKNMQQYADAMIDNFFEHNILPEVCKRLNTEEREQKLSNIKNILFGTVNTKN